MTPRRALLETEPWRFDFLALMQELERSAPARPGIGRSEVLAQDIVAPGQDPFLEFPAANVTHYADRASRPAELRTRFLGFFGPQGALPLTTTIEAYHWMRGRDPAFVRFTDILSTRFLQLFYRAWADARPVALIGRPEEDRFRAFVGATFGLGTPAFRDRDSLDDLGKLAFAGLLGGRVKSATRLRQVLEGLIDVPLRIRERVGCWLELEPSDLSRLGRQAATLGQDTHLGARVHSINDKVVLTFRARSREEYESLLPGRPRYRRIVDLIAFYIGEGTEVDLELELPRAARPAAQLGRTGQLGWTAWSAPEQEPPPAEGAAPVYVTAAVFSTRHAAPEGGASAQAGPAAGAPSAHPGPADPTVVPGSRAGAGTQAGPDGGPDTDTSTDTGPTSAPGREGRDRDPAFS